jgi:hypothetical protein
VNAERQENLSGAATGVFHQHSRRNAKLVDGVLIERARLLTGQE